MYNIYIYICICIYIDTRTYLLISLHVDININAHIYIYIYIYYNVYTCGCVYIRTCMHICMEQQQHITHSTQTYAKLIFICYYQHRPKNLGITIDTPRFGLDVRGDPGRRCCNLPCHRRTNCREHPSHTNLL